MSDRDRNSDSSDRDSGLRQRAIDTYDSALDSAAAAGRRASNSLDEAPLVALGAGLAAGALIAALIPTSRRERELLRPYGDRLSGAARDAAGAAKQAGTDKLRELGLMPDTLADKASQAAKATAQAAIGTFRDEAATKS